MRPLVKQPLKLRSTLGASMLASFGLLAWLLSAMPVLAAVDHEAILRDRLNDVRELLVRRQAHRQMLSGRIERNSSELDRLQAEREATLAVLADHEDRARAYERELDRLMPHLLPRIALLDRLRKEGARAIAGLASMERNKALEDRTRTRLLATQTASIEQMRRASTAVRLLRRVPNELTARHRDVDFQIPLLAAALSRLDLRQSQLQRRRDKAIRDLADLNVDIDRLTTEEHRLARNMLARSLEAADGADMRSGGARAALANRSGLGKSSVSNANIRGIALLRTQPTPVARPLDGIQARVNRAALTDLSEREPSITANGKAPALVTRWAVRSKPQVMEVALHSEEFSADDSENFTHIPPLALTIETIGYNLANGDWPDGRRAIEIAAEPGQPVAAPNDGRIVFAGDFRSYGLLLIIEHGNGYHTLLWGFSSLDIGFGDDVRTGRVLGVLSNEPSPKLHVELRRNGQPVSPEVWLAAGNSGVKG